MVVCVNAVIVPTVFPLPVLSWTFQNGETEWKFFMVHYNTWNDGCQTGWLLTHQLSPWFTGWLANWKLYVLIDSLLWQLKQLKCPLLCVSVLVFHKEACWSWNWMFLLDFVTDFDFSPFDDYVLSTASQDGSVSSVDFFHLSTLNKNWTYRHGSR